MLRGWGAFDVALDLAVLLVYDAIMLLGAAIFVRRQA